MAEPRRGDVKIDLAGKPKVLLVTAPFYGDIIDAMVTGAFQILDQFGCEGHRINVPGSLEIPGAIGHAAGLFGNRGGGYDAYVALGCIIRGATYHFEIVCNESARGLMDLTQRHGLAIGNGIITCENDEQAWERADIGRLNKGADAAQAALSLLAIKQKYR